MDGRPTTRGQSVWLEAIDHWLAGLIFAVLVSCLVVAAAYAPGVGGLFRAIEAAGIDAAMRARQVLAPRAPIGRELVTPPGFVFIDLDTPTCAAAEGGTWCDTRSPSSPTAAARIAAVVMEAEPRVVLLDARLWDVGQSLSPPAAEFRRLAAAAARHPKVRIVAASPFRPSDEPGRGVIEPELVPLELSRGAVKFAPAYAWNTDKVMRRYPAEIEARIEGEHEQRLLTLPYLAALYAKAERGPQALARIDCLAWPIADADRARCQASRSGSKAGEEGDEGPLVLFSLPGLARGEGEARASEAATLRDLYDHYPSSTVVSKAGQLTIRPRLLADKVVVISTSARRAMDWHDTPIGPMSGAEVTLNVVRAFAAQAVLHDPPVGEKLVREATFAAAGSIPFLAFWFLTLSARRRMQSNAWGRRFAWLPAVVLFLPTVLASAWAMIFAASLQANGAFLGGHAVDLFTPLAALSLGAFADAAKSVSTLLERWVRRARESLGAMAVRPRPSEGEP